MSRYQALGHYVYEKGERIGCTPEEASIELARKLNAYQMRIERLKKENERLKNELLVEKDRLADAVQQIELLENDIKEAGERE